MFGKTGRLNSVQSHLSTQALLPNDTRVYRKEVLQRDNNVQNILGYEKHCVGYSPGPAEPNELTSMLRLEVLTGYI